MKVNNCDININEALKFANNDNILIKRRENGFLLSDFQIDILKSNGFDYSKYSSLYDLIFDIEEYLNDYYSDELDLVSGQLAEIMYYKDTKK